MKNEIEENKILSELEENPKTFFWQRPRFPLYFGVGLGLLIILIAAVGLLIETQLNSFSSQTEIAEEEQKQQEETDLLITREKDLTIPSAEEFTEAEIAYVKGGDIWILDTAQQEKIQITKNGLNKDPKWSPDGKKLAWISKKKINYSEFYSHGRIENSLAEDINEEDIYYGVNIKIMDYESGEVEELLEPYDLDFKQHDLSGLPEHLLGGSLSILSFDWSPDGKKIIYSRNGVWIKELEFDRNIRIAEPYLEKEYLLKNQWDEYDMELAFRAYRHQRVSYISDSRLLLSKNIFDEILELQSGNKITSRDIRISGEVSPDHNKVLAGGQAGKWASGLFYYNLIKHEFVTIAEKESLGRSWINDNQVIASLGDKEFFSESFDITIINLDGTIEKQLTSDGREKYLAAISPDKKWAVYWVDQNSIAISLEDGRQVEDMPPSASFSWRPVESSVEKKDNPLILEDHESRRLVPGNIMRLTWEHDNLDYYSNKILLCLIGFDPSYEEIPAKVPWNEDRCTYTSGHSGGSYLIDEALLETGEYIWSIPDDIEKRFEQIPSSYGLRALVFDDLPSEDRTEWAGCVGNYELEVNLEYEKRN